MRVSLQAVTKRYGSTRALDEVSLELEPGRIVAIIGINGAGKTTLLRALAGIVAPDRGQVRFDGESFERNRLDQRRRLWFLPDFPPLFPEETLLGNLGLILRLFGADAPGVESRVLQLLREFDLVGLVHAGAGTLSRGQAYKAALTALLCVNPELWLLDEPFASGMDPVGIAVFRREARTAASQGRTVVYSTQWIEAVEKLADDLCILQHGKVLAFGSLAELRAQTGTQGGELEQMLLAFTRQDG
jgi:ABC-type multidrug transport system ATPase subunit